MDLEWQHEGHNDYDQYIMTHIKEPCNSSKILKASVIVKK